MSRLKVDNIEARSGNNVSMDDPLSLKSYDTDGMNALTATAGDMIYNTTTGSPHFYNGSSWEEAWNKPDLTVDYLVVAGGGGGGGTGSSVADQACGGGGAGGLRSTVGNTGGGGSLETSLTLLDSTNYTVTVGAGGTANGQGNDSVFNSVTSAGGARGQTFGGNGVTGGSGGGGGGDDSGGASNGGNGTPNQGRAGGGGRVAYASGTGGGGGGAGVAGGTGVSDGGGTGGNGVICNIISSSQATTASVGEVVGSDVYYAGGGAGGHDPRGTSKVAKSGGTGGGADSQAGTATGVAGTLNTGGGGSGPGSVSNGLGGTGGRGVVIIKYPDAYTISQSGGLTFTTVTTTGYKMTIFTEGTGNVSFS
jgi:hypothetical protein